MFQCARLLKVFSHHKGLFAGAILCLAMAPWAVSDETASESSETDFWAFRKPQPTSLPVSAEDSWSTSEIDRFIFKQLSEAGLKPSVDARPATFLRRLYFDLIGLPPSAEDIDRFLTQIESDGFEETLSAEVDRLLETRAFGERWGRHWLDVARFAESSGKEANISFPYAWRYRDYVIDCFISDVPFDRFVIEQIAGDLLPYADDSQRARQLNATGFLAIGPKNLDEANAMQFTADVIDEQIDTVSRALMAHTVACARCHDHKADPYTMEDYYALAGIFASTKTYFGTYVSPANRMGGDPLPLPAIPGQEVFHKSIPAKRVVELRNQLASLKKEHDDGMAAIYTAAKEGRDASEIFTLRDALRIFWTSGGIEGQLEQVDEEGKALPLTMGVLDAPQMIDAPFLERGDIHEPGPAIVRRLPSPIKIEAALEIGPDQSGRLELARWLTHPDHPLTSRVIANRVWHHLLGVGIVSTVDDFGSTGQPPSHPELLDYLALQLIDDDWSIKRLIRRIVLSHVYRQASTFDPKSFNIDPDNRLHWRASKRRLDAEAIRDAMLAVSGELDTSRPLGSLVARSIGDRPISLIGLDAKIPVDLDGSHHRSVYLPVLRDRLPDVLAMFDFAEPSLVTGARDTTNVPVQALYLMNSPFIRDRSVAFAELVIEEVDEDQRTPELDQANRDARFIAIAFRRCLGRAPDAKEMEWAKAYLANRSASDDQRSAERKIFAGYCHALFASAEFRNLD